MICWTFGSWCRVQIFKRQNSVNLWKYRYRLLHYTWDTNISLHYFLLIRHNLVTFNQATWTHILVVGQHLVKTLVIHPLSSTFCPRDTFILTITLLFLSTILENVLVPTYWFYSSYINFNELWSSVNVFYRIKRNKKAFYISGNLRPRIGRNIMKMTLRKTQSNQSKESRLTIGNIFGNMSQQVDVDI